MQPDSFKNKITTLAAPYIPLDGMNEKGFAIAVLVVEEAIRILENYDMNSSRETGYHFFLADAQGNSAVVEYIENEMRVLRNTQENPFLAATNFSLTTEEQNGGGKGRYEIIQNGLEKANGIITKEEGMKLVEEAKFIPKTGAEEGTEIYIFYIRVQ